MENVQKYIHHAYPSLETKPRLGLATPKGATEQEKKVFFVSLTDGERTHTAITQTLVSVSSSSAMTAGRSVRPLASSHSQQQGTANSSFSRKKKFFFSVTPRPQQKARPINFLFPPQ